VHHRVSHLESVFVVNDNVDCRRQFRAIVNFAATAAKLGATTLLVVRRLKMLEYKHRPRPFEPTRRAGKRLCRGRRAPWLT
jgi:hypothetical protein